MMNASTNLWKQTQLSPLSFRNCCSRHEVLHLERSGGLSSFCRIGSWVNKAHCMVCKWLHLPPHCKTPTWELCELTRLVSMYVMSGSFEFRSYPREIQSRWYQLLMPRKENLRLLFWPGPTFDKHLTCLVTYNTVLVSVLFLCCCDHRELALIFILHHTDCESD